MNPCQFTWKSLRVCFPCVILPNNLERSLEDFVVSAGSILIIYLEKSSDGIKKKNDWGFPLKKNKYNLLSD